MTAKIIIFVLLFSAANSSAQKINPKNTSSQSPNRNVSSESDELAVHLSAAETYQISGDFDNAALENRLIAGIALERLGNAAIETGEYQNAVKYLTQSKNYADSARRRTLLATAYLKSNQIENALAEARQAVALDPKYSRARYILGNIYFTEENYAAALPELEKVLVLAPDFDSARALALTYLYLKQPERAKLLFEEMLSSIGKDSPDLHVVFARAYEQTNYPLEAEREFKRALAIDPKHPRANFFLGYVVLQYGGSERLTEAGQAFEKELQLTPNDFFSNFFAGVVASSASDHQKAVVLLQKAVILNAESSEAHLFLGQSQMETGDLKAAEKNLRRAIALSVDSTKNGFESRRTHYLLGKLLIADGRRAEGEMELGKARELQSKLVETTRDDLSRLFVQVVGKSKTPEAANNAQLAAQSDATPARVAQLRQVKTYLSEILAQAFHNLGVIAVQRNQPDDALENFASASEWKADFPGLARNWGIVAFRSEQFGKAIVPLERSLKTNPTDNLIRQMLGASYYLTNDFVKTVETLKPLEATVTSDAELAYFYGISLIQLKRNQEASPIFNRLAEISQKSPEALFYAAQGFMILGDYARAVREFRTVAALAPNTPKANYFAGQSLIRLNRYDEAENAFAAELALNPADVLSKYHLALTLIERKIEPEKTIAILQETINLKSDYADARYQLGKIYLERGENQKAVEQLEAAAISAADKDFIHYQLSIAYRKVARKDDADRELKRYQELKAAIRKTEN